MIGNCFVGREESTLVRGGDKRKSSSYNRSSTRGVIFVHLRGTDRRNRQNLLFLVMDDFVRTKLTEWGLSEWIERFKDEGIDEESLYCLYDQDIDNLIPKLGPRAKFRKRLELLQKEQNTTNQETVDSSAQFYLQCQQQHEEAADSSQVWPSTSDTSDKGKRKNILESYTEEIILSKVKHTMSCVHERIPNQGITKLNKFLKDKISDLETDKRELVGVFGKTGAGKSSLINAVIGEKNLLPSGSISACTTVVIKVETNMQSQKYEADIEFIPKEEWKDELWSLFNLLGDNTDQEQEDDDYRETVEKMSALYGEEWKEIPNKSPENLMDNKYFREIPEFHLSRRKILTCESARDLSAKLVKYTRTASEHGDGKRYWPLVKCVTVRVPRNDLLQHVTLVDLPGNGDRNKSRDKMWKGVVGSCSTVWIVTDINRAAAEKEPWEILESTSSLMGNGGQCQQIHFICTKSDFIEDSDDHSAAGVRALIFKRNMQAKEAVSKEYRKLNKVKKHFSDDCFKVLTVSSKEFLQTECLNPDETEIPKLQGFLQNLNDCHSETLNYVSGAYGILSLIQGASCREVADQKTDVCTELEEKMRHELDRVRKPMEEAHEAFEKCLNEGVEKSKSSCERVLKSVLHPTWVKGGGFHKILKCIVANNGTHKPKSRKQINLNVKLASCLTDSIDEEFKKTFPNEGKCGPFNGVINTFSLDTTRLIQKYKDVELQLIFLKTEEKKMKTKLNKIIRERKKTIYSSLTTTIQETMQDCYKSKITTIIHIYIHHDCAGKCSLTTMFCFIVEAAGFRGQDSLKNMRDTIEKHVHDSKNTMFEQAKDVMLNQLRCLKEDILKTLEETMQESIELSLKTDGDSIPDVTGELVMVKQHYNELRGSADEETLICADPPGPVAAP
ncbi:nuclear GTPase SLIP-GC-like isoform X3 [Siniperca chuatsi]|uniref:nuclear GTPase SLIP-GC-like isoform X3 n=1 Tax=Siniperca chuatsi TaxID=119488 RepID=UPI001CE0658E|nr:nuclear GTPase SLIP-GC-like isoform X3 [Siniperca chuatsi]